MDNLLLRIFIVILPLIPVWIIWLGVSGRVAYFKDEEEMYYLGGNFLFTIFILSVVFFLAYVLLHPIVCYLGMGYWAIYNFMYIFSCTAEANNHRFFRTLFALVIKILLFPFFMMIYFLDHYALGTDHFLKFCQKK